MPAAGVEVRAFRREGEALLAVGSGTTGSDGRIERLLDSDLTPGWYQLVFELSSYFGSQQHFFTRVTLDIAVAHARHHHVPLLVSPYSCTTYRGS